MNYKKKLYDAIKKNDIRSIIDIGANVGQFAKEIKSIFPNISILCIEPNVACEPYLKSLGFPYIICCPSDKSSIKNFYKMKNDPIGTGHSLYKENSHHYEGDNLLVEKIRTDTLDSILEKSNFNKEFDLIKIDTQGSEYDILMGCQKTLSKCKMVLAETDVLNYNQGCASQQSVIDLLCNAGFKHHILIENQISNGNICQQDLLFFRDTCVLE